MAEGRDIFVFGIPKEDSAILYRVVELTTNV